jgi:hypothetical protein
VWTLMTRSESIVSTYTSPKNEKEAWISVLLRLYGVFYRRLNCWTRLPANVLTPRALESFDSNSQLAAMRSSHDLSEIQEREASKR